MCHAKAIENENRFIKKFLTFVLNLLQGKEAWYSVDNERLEAQPITIQLLPRKLQFFTDRQDRDTLIGASKST